MWAESGVGKIFLIYFIDVRGLNEGENDELSIADFISLYLILSRVYLYN